MGCENDYLGAFGRSGLGTLSPDVEARITAAIDRFALSDEGDVKRLTGEGGELRLRVGDWRVRFELGEGSIIVNRIIHRGRAYRD
jgi:mRNA-degrading endonuclease RelE of RelBE toxin-antitoxin system